MRAAPAVRFSSRGGRPWHWIQALLAAAAAAATAAWAVGWAQGSDGAAAAVALLAASVAPAIAGLRIRWQAERSYVLGWDGSRWWLVAPGGPRIGGRVRPGLDLGNWMLVRFDADRDAPPRWLPVARRDAPADWPAWRAAVYAAAAMPGASGAAP
jgi:hypothetical protein